MTELKVVSEINQIKSQLSYSKNIGFFFGAGTSCSLGLPDINNLTATVESSLKNKPLEHFGIVKNELEEEGNPQGVNIEDILNQVRRIREITNESSDRKYNSIDGKSARNLDTAICNAIYSEISELEQKADLKKTQKLLAWLSRQNRDFAKELFTTNYDLILERSFEHARIPYFDGFVGSYEPFFWQDSVDRNVEPRDLTRNWIRLWKLHGSLGWFWKGETNQIMRLGNVNEAERKEKETVIYPSRDKYDTSRKQPFVAYFDRLKDFLQSGELLFLVSGYSFSDQHINDILFNSLRQNTRLTVLAFVFTDETFNKIQDEVSPYQNMSVFSPYKGLINGSAGKWNFDDADIGSPKNHNFYWDSDKKQVTLGDFGSLVDFLVSVSGFHEQSSKS